MIIIFNQRDQHSVASNLAGHDDDSARWPRKAFTSIVRSRIKSSRTRCRISTLCCASLFTGTKLIIGHRLANRLGICDVVLLWWPPSMQEPSNLMCPVIECVLLSGLSLRPFKKQRAV